MKGREALIRPSWPRRCEATRIDRWQQWPEKIDDARVRVDTYLRSGATIPVYYDSLVCKLIVAGADRERARLGMLAALEAFRIEGIQTTAPLHRKILADERFRSGSYDTTLVEQLLEPARGKA